MLPPIDYSQYIDALAPAPFPHHGSHGGKPPKKYVKIDGITKLNPEYKKWKEAKDGKPATSVANADQALPVVTSMDDHAALCEQVGDVALSESTAATVDIIQEDDEACLQIGVAQDEVVDELGKIFAKYEVPMGLMNKLMGLTEFDRMEFIIDDSGSMNAHSDTKNAQGYPQTRWEEAKGRMKEMLEVLAYVPTPPITIRFLNRTSTIDLHHNGQPPKVFLNDACFKLDQEFSAYPAGGTPAEHVLRASLNRYPGKSVARYFFGDGAPGGGKAEEQRITDMITNRSNPSGNPITFLSCTNEDDQVEWMKEAEEKAPYCAEYDDFEDERREVLGDQGTALPYTQGFHLIGQLVGAMNPDDLDAMDESIPFTKFTLESLLGIKCSDQEFRHYFDGFKKAQQQRPGHSAMDQLKRNQNWETHYELFRTTNVAKEIPAVQTFKQQIRNCK